MYGLILDYYSIPPIKKEASIYGDVAKTVHAGTCACKEKRSRVIDLISTMRTEMKQERSFGQCALWLYDSFCHKATPDVLHRYVYSREYDSNVIIVMACVLLAIKILRIDPKMLGILDQFFELSKAMSCAKYAILEAEVKLLQGVKYELSTEGLPAKLLEAKTGWVSATEYGLAGVQSMQMLDLYYKDHCFYERDPEVVVEAVCEKMQRMFPGLRYRKNPRAQKLDPDFISSVSEVIGSLV